MFDDWAKAVASKWTTQGIVRDGVAPASIDDLAQRHGIALPASFRALYLISDGTAAMDDDEFIFWPLDNVADDPSLPTMKPYPLRQLIFADWRLTGCVYALTFDAGVAKTVTSTRAIDNAAQTVATSFDAFLERYVAEPRTLIVR